jgi:hypothetical protein
MADPTEADEAETEEQAPKKNWRRELEDRAKVAEERSAQLERELAFTQAGLTGLSVKQRVALSAAHEGEFTAENLKATADELGFGAKPQANSGESTPSAEAEPDHSSEVSELAELSNSPAQHSSPAEVIRTQEAFDEKVRSFETEAELDAFLRENLDLLPHG